MHILSSRPQLIAPSSSPPIPNCIMMLPLGFSSPTTHYWAINFYWKCIYWLTDVKNFFHCRSSSALALLTHLFHSANKHKFLLRIKPEPFDVPLFELWWCREHGKVFEPFASPSSVFCTHKFLSLHRFPRQMPLSILCVFFFALLHIAFLAHIMFVINFTPNNPKVLSKVSRSIIHYLHVITFHSVLSFLAKYERGWREKRFTSCTCECQKCH